MSARVQTDEDFLLEVIRGLVADALDAGWNAREIHLSHDDALVQLMEVGGPALCQIARAVGGQITGQREALDRVRAVCDGWDRLSRGETSTTARIRAAIDGRQL